jgi:hypothetical protein
MDMTIIGISAGIKTIFITTIFITTEVITTEVITMGVTTTEVIMTWVITMGDITITMTGGTRKDHWIAVSIFFRNTFIRTVGLLNQGL